MKPNLAKWSLVLLCFSMAGATGGGLYEHIVLTPLWSTAPPLSFSIIQPIAGVPLQNFWIPVHAAITIFILSSLFLTWKEVKVRRLLLIGLGSSVLHSRDARVSKSTSRFPSIRRTFGESRSLDLLVVVQRAFRHNLVPLLFVSPFLVEET